MGLELFKSIIKQKSRYILSAFLFCTNFNVSAQTFELTQKYDLSIFYKDRFKFAISKLIDSNFYIFKTDNLTHTELVQSNSDTLFCFSFLDKKIKKVYCKWPKNWVDSRSIISDFFVAQNTLYVSFDKSIYMFKINWDKQSIKLKKVVKIGYFESINGVSNGNLYFGSTYDYDNSVIYPGPYIGELNLKSRKIKIRKISKKGIEFSHFPSRRLDFSYNQFVVADVLDFKIRIYNDDLNQIDSIDFSNNFSNNINGIYYDYTKLGLQTIKEQDKNLFRIIKVYRSNNNKIYVVFKDSTCKTRNQFKLCTIVKTNDKWNMEYVSGIINENESLISLNFIPWLNSSSLYHFIDNKLIFIGTKNINFEKNSSFTEKKEFSIYIYTINK